MSKLKLFRVTTVPLSLEKLLENQLSYMQQFYEVTAISSDRQRLEEFGKKEGVKTFYVNLTRKITIFQDLKALWKMYSFFKKENPFIVHTHTPKAGLIGMVAARLAGVPHRLHTVAGLPLLEKRGFLRFVLNLVEIVTYQCATFIYPNSYGLKKIIESEGLCKTQKLRVIGNGSSNGINTDYFNPEKYSNREKESLKEKLGIRSEDLVFIFVGRIVSDKGINELVSAFNELCYSEKYVKLILVGDLEIELDPLFPETVEIIAANKNIISVGYQSDIRHFLAISDVLTFPSYREGFPNVVMQAGAMGLPSIVSDINGCNEIITDGNNGFIVPPKNTESLLKAMRFFLEKNIDLLHDEEIRANIIENYAQEKIWKLLLIEYEALKVDV